MLQLADAIRTRESYIVCGVTSAINGRAEQLKLSLSQCVGHVPDTKGTHVMRIATLIETATGTKPATVRSGDRFNHVLSRSQSAAQEKRNQFLREAEGRMDALARLINDRRGETERLPCRRNRYKTARRCRHFGRWRKAQIINYPSFSRRVVVHLGIAHSAPVPAAARRPGAFRPGRCNAALASARLTGLSPARK